MSASASASTSTSTNPPSNSHPPSTSQDASSSQVPSVSQSASPTLPHSPETARQIAEARAALEASMSNIGSSLDHTLKSRAQNLHSNSSALEKQQKELVKETEKMRKETDKLKKVADDGARRVKELGNVQNWAEMLERDFLVLSETMRLVRKGDGESGWDGNEDGWETSSGSGSWSSEGEKIAEEEGVGSVSLPDHEGETGGEQRARGEAGGSKDVERFDKTVRPVETVNKAVDAEGDIVMDGTVEHQVDHTGKGKQVEPHHKAELAENLSISPTIRSANTEAPLQGSIHNEVSKTS